MVVALEKKYTGAVAARYEHDRKGSWKWRFENTALEQMLSTRLDIDTLIDIPCGTGRFHDLYKRLDIDAIGVDASVDMLRQADDRGMLVQEHDLFTFPVSQRFDAVVCFRFLNWVNMDALKSAATLFSKLSRKHVFMTISTANPARVSRSGTQFFPTMDELVSAVDDINFVDMVSRDCGNGIISNVIAGRVL